MEIYAHTQSQSHTYQPIYSQRRTTSGYRMKILNTCKEREKGEKTRSEDAGLMRNKKHLNSLFKMLPQTRLRSFDLVKIGLILRNQGLVSHPLFTKVFTYWAAQNLKIMYEYLNLYLNDKIILTASASALSLDPRLPTMTDSSTATQRCLSGKLGAMK